MSVTTNTTFRRRMFKDMTERDILQCQVYAEHNRHRPECHKLGIRLIQLKRARKNRMSRIMDSFYRDFCGMDQ